MKSLFDVSNALRSDSYKFSHWRQLPPNTTNVYSYCESRGGVFSETVFVGLNYYIKEYLSRPITLDDIVFAKEIIDAHMGPGIFNWDGFKRIVDVHKGYWPVRIKAVPEGTVVPTRNVLMTLESTDEQLPWVPNFIETMLLKVWYPTTVATLAREIKKLILTYLHETGDPEGINFKLHDFGYRGVSSEESAGIGSLAHLSSFMGTDTVMGLIVARLYYNEHMAGFSIPAAEHFTITAWGQEFEYEAYKNMIDQFGNGSMYAVVSDSYNIYEACENLWGGTLLKKVMEAPGVLVVRPDSGVPHEVVRQIVEILGKKFGYTTNEKGYKVLTKVRVIQGDGINLDEIARILEALKVRGWSADNVAFGMGGALLQQVHRDTQKFALKASSIIRGGTIRDIFKSPVTDNGKRSKRGRLKLINNDSVLETVDVHMPGKDLLELVWENGVQYTDPTLAEIRQRAQVNIMEESIL